MGKQWWHGAAGECLLLSLGISQLASCALVVPLWWQQRHLFGSWAGAGHRGVIRGGPAVEL